MGVASVVSAASALAAPLIVRVKAHLTMRAKSEQKLNRRLNCSGLHHLAHPLV